MFVRQLALLGWTLSVCRAPASIVPTSLDDPDEWIPLEPPESPGDEDYWNTYSRQAEAIGLLYAGGAEFPWIVDIRLANTDQELWAVGNLVTVSHVLTTCRAMFRLVQHFPWDPDDPNRQVVKNYQADIEVNFCSIYLWESYDGGKKVNRHKSSLVGEQNIVSGTTRSVYGISFHPSWATHSLEFDVSVLQINKGIPPEIPSISYMPIPENIVTGQIAEPDLSKQETNRWVCYIASFGKNSNNLRTNVANDYKVKYRVYFMDWEKCEEYFKWLCPRKYSFCVSTSTRQSHGKLNCFRSHAKVGAICDHDTGAPLVCNGFVYGIVVRGVDFKYCHNLTPFPAIIRRTDFLKEYLTNLLVAANFEEKSQGASLHKNSMRFPSLEYLSTQISFWIFLSNLRLTQ